jgi:hypothetical protein
MEAIFSFVVGLLTAALSLLGFVQQHPELPPASRDQAQQIAQQAITQATQALATNPPLPTTQNSSALRTYSHPSDGYTFSYNSDKLEAHTTATTEFPSNTSLQPSSAVFSDGGYGQEVEILTYQGTAEAAQEAFIGAYRQYYSPQVLGAENVTINGNSARVVTYRVSPTYPEAKVYLIAYRPNEPRTIVATGDHDIIATIKTETGITSQQQTGAAQSVGSFAAIPTSGPAPLLVSFTGGANGASVDFGDGSSGSFAFPMCLPGRKCDPVTSHRYTSPGTFVVVLGGSGARINVKVDNSGSTQNGTLRAVMSRYENQPLLVEFELSTSQSRSYSLDFGDGTPLATLPTGCTGPAHVCGTEHTYAASGTYVASLKMDGVLVATATVTVGK